MKTITNTIELTYKIKGFDMYQFGKDKCLYNVRTGRKIKQSYNNGSIGYWLSKKFMSIKAIKPLLYKPSKEFCPF